MSQCEDRHNDFQPSLRRISSFLDCPGLLSQCASFKSERRHTEFSSCSENSQVLYMAPTKRSRRTDCSLSSVSNGFDRRADGSADDETIIEAKISPSAEQLSWNVIDREIFEWQYVCQTGRPYWWSPEAKYARLKLQPRLANDPCPRIWMKNIDQRAKPAYEEKRRVVSDSYLADPSTVQDLAHLVAIQLLGACFTLPPDHVISVPAPNYSFDQEEIPSIPNPRMISSLSLHTHFRYSPSFGHQARNTSPVQLWPGIFDGPSNSEVASPSDDTLDKSGPSLTRPRLQSRTSFTVEPGSEDFGRTEHERLYTDLFAPITTTAWYRRNAIRDLNSRVFRLPHIPIARSRLKRKRLVSKTEISSEDHELLPGVKASHTMPNTDTHHRTIEYAQTKKRYAARRWAKLRTRFGSSLHTDTSNGEPENVSFASEQSTGATAGIASKRTSSRRRRTQDRGNIETSSMDESPHYNSPTSGNLSPDEIGLQSLSPTSTFHPAEPLNTAAALAAFTYQIPQFSDRRRQSLILSSSEMSTLEPPCKLSVPQIDTSVASFSPGPTRNDSCDCLHPNTSPTSIGPAIPTPLRRVSTRGRERRRSMLSEVWTPGDFVEYKTRHRSNCSGNCDRHSASVAGSALASPREEVEQLSFAAPGLGEVMTSGHDGTISRGSDSLDEVEIERPRFHRTSWGTQILTPNADGIEVDGLPVGPGQDTWADRETGERTYL